MASKVQLAILDVLKKCVEEHKEGEVMITMVKSFVKIINDSEDVNCDVSSVPKEVLLSCTVCQNPATRCCEKCGTLYCTTVCRVKDWRGIHQYICLGQDRVDSVMLTPAQKKIIHDIMNTSKLPIFDQFVSNDSNLGTEVLMNGMRDKTVSNISVDGQNTPTKSTNDNSNRTPNNLDRNSTAPNPVNETTQKSPTKKIVSTEHRNGKMHISRNNSPKNELGAHNKHSISKNNNLSHNNEENRDLSGTLSPQTRPYSGQENNASGFTPKDENSRQPHSNHVPNNLNSSGSKDHQAMRREGEIDLYTNQQLSNTGNAGFTALHYSQGSTLVFSVASYYESGIVIIPQPVICEGSTTYYEFSDSLNKYIEESGQQLYNTRAREHNTLMAVVKVTEDNSKWKRAFSFYNGWFLIDEGLVLKKRPDIRVKWNICPPKYANEPYYSCLLSVSSSKIAFKVGSTHIATVTEVNKSAGEVLLQFKLGYITIYGKLTQWVGARTNRRLSESTTASEDALTTDKCNDLAKMNCSGQDKDDSQLLNSTENLKPKDAEFVTFKSLEKILAKDGMIVNVVQFEGVKKAFIRLKNKENIIEDNDIIDSILLQGRNAKVLEKKPAVDDVVVVKTKNLFYRAVILSCSMGSALTANYKVRLIDTGEVLSDITMSEMKCVPKEVLAIRRTLQYVKLAGLNKLESKLLKPCVTEYMNDLIKNNENLIYKTTESGVILKVEKTYESVNERILQMSMSQWKAVVDSGDDIITSTPVYMLEAMEYVTLQKSDLLVIMDNSSLKTGSLYCIRGEPEAVDKLDTLNEELADYSNKITEPYMPRYLELCIAKFDEDDKWYRAFVMAPNQGDMVSVMFVDYGNIARCNYKNIRKMMPDFIDALPAQACCCRIKDFSKDPEKYISQADTHFTMGNLLKMESLEYIEPGNYNITISPEVD